MSTVKAVQHQVGNNATDSKNIVLTADVSTGDLVISKGVYDGTLTEISRIMNAGGGAQYVPAGTGAVATTVQAKLRESVSVLDFGADPTGVADSTAAIQAALDYGVRRVFFPAGIYRITSTLTINQDAILEGDGGSGELNSSLANTTNIYVDGNFDGFTLKETAPSYYGWLTMKNITIRKTGGTANTNSGLKILYFAPHVILERVYCLGFNTGFNIYVGIAQINSCEARDCITGYALRSTSMVVQNSYARLCTTGYSVSECAYSAFISCAADEITGSAYSFVATTGPFTTRSVSFQCELISCGAEVSGKFLYVDGNFDITVSAPSAFSTVPQAVYIESARTVRFKSLAQLNSFNWLYVNTAKCTPDVVVIDGDVPLEVISTMPSLYTGIPITQTGIKSSYGLMRLSKTAIANIGADVGISGHNSYVEKGVFTSGATAANKLRFRAKVLGAGHGVCAMIKYCMIVSIGNPAAFSGEIYLQAYQGGGLDLNAQVSSGSLLTVTTSTAATTGGTYCYFDVSGGTAFTPSFLFDVTCYTAYEEFGKNMFTEYNNWTVVRL
jgi:hypothetical protein